MMIKKIIDGKEYPMGAGDVVYVAEDSRKYMPYIPTMIVAVVSGETGEIEFGDYVPDEIVEWFTTNEFCNGNLTNIMNLSMKAVRKGISSISEDGTIPTGDRLKMITSASTEDVVIYSEVLYENDDSLDWGEMRINTCSALSSIFVKDVKIID